MPVVVMLNQKGGVSKTTLTANLGGVLAKQGRRVLLVDADPQSSLTQGVIGPEATSALPAESTIVAAYRGAVVRPEQVVIQTAFAGLDLVPGSELAAEFNNGRPHEQPWEQQAALVELLGELAGGYDLILVDCPPNLGLCSWSALAAGDAVCIPVQPEDYGAQGLPAVMRSIGLARQVVNPRLSILGLVVTMYQPRRTLHQVYAETLRQQYGDSVFATAIPEAAEVPEATMLRKPVAYHKPRGVAAKAFAALADEMLARLATGQGTQEEAA